MDVQGFTVGRRTDLKHIVFRADASLEIGTGHVMRCLTLADALQRCGAQSVFVCRPHVGHLLNLIAERGHEVITLSDPKEYSGGPDDLAHAAWLGASCEEDALQTREALAGQTVDWLVVDHYGLDRRWEKALRDLVSHIMVIDDIADRPHDCDLLLDQTYGRSGADYAPFTPDGCRVLCGSQYALLRPEFAALREYSLTRRKIPVFKKLLITMGGVDKDNATGAVLKALRNCSLPENVEVTVVMGQSAPWLQEVKELVATMPWSTRILVAVSDMAQLMADSDLAIGAAGATSWERCCLGLPSVLLLTAENQQLIISNLVKNEAVKSTNLIALNLELKHIINDFLSKDYLVRLSKISADVCDGLGVQKVTAIING